MLWITGPDWCIYEAWPWKACEQMNVFYWTYEAYVMDQIFRNEKHKMHSHSLYRFGIHFTSLNAPLRFEYFQQSAHTQPNTKPNRWVPFIVFRFSWSVGRMVGSFIQIIMREHLSNLFFSSLHFYKRCIHVVALKWRKKENERIPGTFQFVNLPKALHSPSWYLWLLQFYRTFTFRMQTFY